MPLFSGPSTWVQNALISESTLNVQIRDNFDHLKNTAQVTYQSDFVMPPYRRETRMLWEGATTTGMQADAFWSDGGTVLIGGAGQLVLKTDNDASGSARETQSTAINNAVSNNWGTTHNPYFRQEFSLTGTTISFHMFLGLRTSTNVAIPTTERHWGLNVSGSTWHASIGDGVTQTATTASDALRPSLNARHVVEISVHNSSNIYFWIDGSTFLTLDGSLVTSSMVRWSLQAYSTGNGTAAEDTLVTLGQNIMQESGGV